MPAESDANLLTPHRLAKCDGVPSGQTLNLDRQIPGLSSRRDWTGEEPLSLQEGARAAWLRADAIAIS